MSDDERWDGYPKSAWDRDSLAVIASDGKGNGAVLFAAGPYVRMEVEETGLSTLEDLGLGDAPLGVSVWVGRYHYNGLDGDSLEVRGRFREPSYLEWGAIKRGKCP